MPAFFFVMSRATDRASRAVCGHLAAQGFDPAHPSTYKLGSGQPRDPSVAHEIAVSFQAFAAAVRRLDRHPYQGLMNSYHAASYMSTDGRVKGTACHFDPAPVSLSNEDFELLRLAARIFPIHLRQALETCRNSKQDDA